jgi:hypothetical protein
VEEKIGKEGRQEEKEGQIRRRGKVGGGGRQEKGR